MSRVVVTREPEWDDYDRVEAEAFDLSSRLICSCGCGQPVDVTRDKQQAWIVDHDVCQARRALDIAQRDFAQEQMSRDDRDPDWRKGKPDPHDGRMWTVAPYHPDEDVQEG